MLLCLSPNVLNPRTLTNVFLLLFSSPATLRITTHRFLSLLPHWATLYVISSFCFCRFYFIFFPQPSCRKQNLVCFSVMNYKEPIHSWTAQNSYFKSSGFQHNRCRAHTHTRDRLCRCNTLNTTRVTYTAKLPCSPPYERAKVKKRNRGHERMSEVGREMEKSVVGKERERVETHRDRGSGAYWSHESHMGTTRLTESS